MPSGDRGDLRLDGGDCGACEALVDASARLDMRFVIAAEHRPRRGLREYPASRLARTGAPWVQLGDPAQLRCVRDDDHRAVRRAHREDRPEARAQSPQDTEWVAGE